MWTDYLQKHFKKEQEWKFKIECYLAKLIAETRRSWIADAKAVNDKDFFVVFKKDEDKEVDNKEQQVESSKKFWLGGLGLLKKKRKKK